MANKKFGAITSSQDPEAIANKVKGVVLALSSVIAFLVAQLFNVQLSPQDMVGLASSLGAVAGGIWAIYGAGLHILALVFKTE